MENSIEKDIILLKDFIEGNFKRDKLENYKGSCKMGYFYYKDIQQAIDHILSDYKRVLKENEELKEDRDKFKKALGRRITYCNELEKDLFENSSNYVIKKQKVKDKIEELKKKVEELTDEKGYWGGSDLLEQIKVLQVLLEKEK